MKDVPPTVKNAQVQIHVILVKEVIFHFQVNVTNAILIVRQQMIIANAILVMMVIIYLIINV